MRIVFLRHTQSVANHKKIYSGKAEYELTSKGKKEILETKKFLNEFYNVDEFEIYSSPLKRCNELAEAILNLQKHKIVKREELIEYDFGEFEGFSYKELKNDKSFKLWCDDYINYKIPNGESISICSSRVNRFVDEVLKNNKDIIVISHQGIIKLAMIYLLNLSLNDFWKFEIKNGAIVEIEYNDGFAYLKNLINCNK